MLAIINVILLIFTMSYSFYIPATVKLELLTLPEFEKAGVNLAVLRLDKTDEGISGNKWFKLRYHIESALSQQAKGLISVGGAYSNHLHALAIAGQQLGMATVGLIRGYPKQTPTCQDLSQFGMEVDWLSYGEYRERYQATFWQRWLTKYAGYYAVPEGGGGLLGAKGCCVIPQLISEQLVNIGWHEYDAIYVSVGTASTLAGIVWGDAGQHQVVGCLAVPSKYGVAQQLTKLLDNIPVNTKNYKLLSATRKGFGQLDDELLAYMKEVEQLTGLLLDPVYTAKTLYLLQQQVIAGQIARGSRIVFIHTGGLQGRRAMFKGEKKMGN